jgi:hypothetical protein
MMTRTLALVGTITGIQNRDSDRQTATAQQTTKQANSSGTRSAAGHKIIFHIVRQAVKLNWEQLHRYRSWVRHDDRQSSKSSERQSKVSGVEAILLQHWRPPCSFPAESFHPRPSSTFVARVNFSV